MRLTLQIFLLIGSLVPNGVGADSLSNDSGWTSRARRLTGESERVRAESIAALRRTPGLENALRGAFETGERFLAFDVIVALKLRSFLPALIDYSRHDRTGYAYHTMNALASEGEAPGLLSIYRERIADPGLFPVAKMTIIDSLARTSSGMSPADLKRLLRDEVPEVRSAAIGYLRYSVVRRGRIADIGLLAPAFRDPADLLRLQALWILAEIRGPARKAVSGTARTLLRGCRDDSFTEVRRLCARLAAEYGS